MSTFKVLENEGYRIAKRRLGTKRSIKFQDSNRSLVMDVKLPSASWVRIAPEDVISAVSGRRRERMPAVAEILEIGGEPLPPPATTGTPFGTGQQQQQQGGQRPDGDIDDDMAGDDVAGEQY